MHKIRQSIYIGLLMSHQEKYILVNICIMYASKAETVHYPHELTINNHSVLM